MAPNPAHDLVGSPHSSVSNALAFLLFVEHGRHTSRVLHLLFLVENVFPPRAHMACVLYSSLSSEVKL